MTEHYMSIDQYIIIYSASQQKSVTHLISESIDLSNSISRGKYFVHIFNLVTSTSLIYLINISYILKLIQQLSRKDLLKNECNAFFTFKTDLLLFIEHDLYRRIALISCLQVTIYFYHEMRCF